MGGKRLGLADYEQSTAKKPTKKLTKKEKFPADMEQVVPWKECIELIVPHYPKTSKKGD